MAYEINSWKRKAAYNRLHMESRDSVYHRGMPTETKYTERSGWYVTMAGNACNVWSNNHHNITTIEFIHNGMVYSRSWSHVLNDRAICMCACFLIKDVLDETFVASKRKRK